MKSRGNCNNPTKRASQKFAVGDSVETSKGEKCVILYVGKVDGLSSLEMFGVEYIDGTIGDHDGSYNGRQYFRGALQRCSFIKYNKIRRKTKHYENGHVCAKHQTKHRHYRGHSTPSLCSQQSRAVCNSSKDNINVNKRKSMPTQLNEFNASKRCKKVKKKSSQLPSQTKLRSYKSAESSFSSSKTAKKSIPSIATATQKKVAMPVSKSLKRVVNRNPIINKSYHHISKPKRITSKPATVTATASRSRKSNDFSHDYQSTKNVKHAIQCRDQRSARNPDNIAASNGSTVQCRNDRSKSVGNKQRKLQQSVASSKTVLLSPTIKERVNRMSSFSSMNSLHLDDSDADDDDDGMEHNSRRKNALCNVTTLSQALHDVCLLTGDIHIGHRYELKDGRCGICLYCGTLHYKNDGNEYVGIALEKGQGKHDGEIRGKRYFACKRNCGVFVSRKRLKKDCGAVQQKIIDSVSSLQTKRPSHSLYEDDSEISDLSDINDIGCCLSDDTRSHSGHSDVGCSGEHDEPNDANERVSIDSQDTVLSYIDVFSSTSHPNQSDDQHAFVATQWESDDHDMDTDEKRYIAQNHHQQQPRHKKTNSQYSKNNDKMTTKPKISKKHEHSKSAPTHDYALNDILSPTLAELSAMNGVCKRKRTKAKTSMLAGDDEPTVLKPSSSSSSHMAAQSPFICESPLEEKHTTVQVSKPIRKRRNATSIVTVPCHKVSATNDFYIDLSSKSLTPLHCIAKKISNPK